MFIEAFRSPALYETEEGFSETLPDSAVMGPVEHPQITYQYLRVVVNGSLEHIAEFSDGLWYVSASHFDISDEDAKHGFSDIFIHLKDPRAQNDPEQNVRVVVIGPSGEQIR